MTRRRYEEIEPTGYIVVNGVRYILLHPEPLNNRDAWANGLLYFSVAKSGEYLDWVEHNGVQVWTYARTILVVHPQNMTMEIGYHGKPLLVWTGEYMISQNDVNPLEVLVPTLLVDDVEEYFE